MNIDELDQQYKAEVLEYEKRIADLLNEMSVKDSEIEQLRAIFPRILKALGNGARCTEDVSLEFLEDIPNEIKLEISDYKKELKIADSLIGSLVSVLSGFEEIEDGVLRVVVGPTFQEDFNRAANWGNPDVYMVSPCGDYVPCKTCINNEDCVKETVKDSLMDDIAESTGQE